MTFYPSGVFSIIISTSHLNPSAPFKSFPVTGIYIAKILSTLVSLARGNFFIKLKPAAFVSNLSYIMSESVRNPKTDSFILF